MSSINKAKVRNHIWVLGDVQGINFRAGIKKQADKYGVSGFAKNLLCGQVEVLLEGERAAVLEVVGWIGTGRHLAKIKRLESRWERFINEFKEREFEMR